jgi:hypothetical protein
MRKDGRREGQRDMKKLIVVFEILYTRLKIAHEACLGTRVVFLHKKSWILLVRFCHGFRLLVVSVFWRMSGLDPSPVRS